MQIQTITKFFFGFLLAVGVSGVCFAESVNWQAYSSSAFAQAKKTHRMVLLFGKAEWCQWCQRMKSQTFSDSSVVSLINKNFVPVRIDIDSDSGVADKYDISVVPSFVILTGDYKVVDSKTGYLNASQMASFLRSNAN